MGLRTRLVILVGVVSLPLVALVLHQAIAGYSGDEEEARRRVERLAVTVVGEESEIIERARHLMIALAELPVVRERQYDRCATLFARLLGEYKVYTTLGVTDTDGTIVCSAPSGMPGATLADRPIFARLRAARGFIVGEYAIGRLSGKPSLGLAYPVKAATGELRGMVFGAVDLGWLSRLLGDVEPLTATTVTLIDRNGVVFTRLPHDEGWSGQSVREAPIVRALGAQRQVTGRLRDLDGRVRIFALSRLSSDPDAMVAVGLDDAAVHGAMVGNVVRAAGVVIIALALVVAAAWFGAASLLVRPLRGVIAATRSFGSGDLGTRVGARAGGGELAELARAFDEMAATVARRTRQAEHAEQRYRGLFERNLAGMFRTHEGRFLECNSAFARLFGYNSPAEIMERPTIDFYADPSDRTGLLDELADGGSVARELRGRRKDGSEVWILVQIVEVRTDTTTYREGLAIDVTDRRRQEAIAREAAALREISALAGAAAHEINNPLTVVVGQLQLVSRDIGDERRLKDIWTAIGRITEIIARMARITRLERSVPAPGIPPMLDIRRSSDPEGVS